MIDDSNHQQPAAYAVDLETDSMAANDDLGNGNITTGGAITTHVDYREMAPQTDNISANASSLNQVNTTQFSFETARRSLASRLRFDASWDKASWSMHVAIFLQILAVVQWLIFSRALLRPFDLGLGFYSDILIIGLFFIVNAHRNYWQKQLQFYELEAKYLGAYD